MFFSSKHGEKNIFSPQYLKYNAGLANALVLYPVETAKQMLEMHQYFLLPLLQKTYEGIHELQEKMKDIQQLLPEGILFVCLFKQKGYHILDCCLLS